MRIGPSLILAGRQTLAMTPQLQQAIKLLQFSHLELAAYIQQELEKNPLLAEGASDDGPANEPEAPVAEAPNDTADTLAAAAPALAEADDRWTREYADRGGDAAAPGPGNATGQREDGPTAPGRGPRRGAGRGAAPPGDALQHVRPQGGSRRLLRQAQAGIHGTVIC